MKPGIPWSVKGIEPEVREAAKHAARRAGMTLGEWLNSVILDQNEPGQVQQQPAEEALMQESFENEPDTEAAPQSQSSASSWRRPETSIRLSDIAQQLSQLAQRERESATIMPYEAPRQRSEDRDTLSRILNRIDNNERQAVEAFTAVNERLSVLGRQIAMVAKPQPIQKPEDIPGYSALETAIRNVVEHIEVSEKRTRDSLKSMQDRLGSMAERATKPSNPDELVRAAPAFSNLEARIAEMAGRLQRSENLLQSGLPELVRDELNQLADRIEGVRASSEQMASQAQAKAAGVARNELHDVETRILGVLKEAQATIGSQQSVVTDLQRLRGEVGSFNKRIDEVKQVAASQHDVHALRVAVEQLSTRVAQGPDMRPIADMDRRLGELTHRLEQSNAATRHLPQFGELERRIAELDHRLGEAVRLQGNQDTLKALDQHLAAVNERVTRTEDQLGHLETMERAIHQLYDSLEQSRSQVSQTAEEAANRVAERLMSERAPTGPSPELKAMEEGLKAVRESAASAEQRNQETLEAVHETLEQIVNKLAELETAAAGHQLAVNMAHQLVEQPQPDSTSHALNQRIPHQPAGLSQFYDPTGAFEEQDFAPRSDTRPVAEAETPVVMQADHPSPLAQYAEPTERPQARASEFEMAPAFSATPDFAAGAAADGDDFIAAARRAAHAAAIRPSATSPDAKPASMQEPAKSSKFSFFKSKQPASITYVNGQPVIDRPVVSINENKRKKLVLAGIVLLAAVSAFAFNILAKPKVAKQSSSNDTPAIVMPVQKTSSERVTAAEPLASVATIGGREDQKLTESVAVRPADQMATGSLPENKTDSALTAIVTEPLQSRVEMPPPAVGTAELRAAAAGGDAKAQFIVASRYLDGQGVEQDLSKAAYWYQLAAERGLAPAQYRLATLFERGKGVPQQAATALLWYERAAEGGNVKSMHNAAVIAAGNQAGTPNYDKAFRWFKAAAERGLHDSQFNLAVLYERGLGTRVDSSQAFVWYSLAGKQGDGDATKRANKLAQNLTGPEATELANSIAKWSPLPTTDEANVIALTDPSWNAQTAEAPAEAMIGESAAQVPAPVEAAIVDTAPAPAAATPVATADPIIETQELLTKLGYNVGTPDGKMGSRTANAIRLFQLQSGLKVTGNVSPELIDVMRTKAGA